MFVNRRFVVGGLCALPFTQTGIAATDPDMMIYPYPGPYELTSDDITWFRSCRALWIDAEAGAPGIFGPGLEPETMWSVSGAVYDDFQRRMEPIQCAFFLHAEFRPGRFAISRGETGTPTVVDVTETDITLLKHTSWRAFTIDSKRPYGELNNYPVEMAQALGLGVSKDDQGYATIDPEFDQKLRALHQKTQLVLQAYIEHAELSSGHWLIPFNGWDAIISPRCRPVGQAAIDRYKAAMAALAERARNETAVDLVVPLINTSAELFASP